MRLLPYERLTLFVEAAPDVVAARLVTMVATGWFSLGRSSQPLRGSVQGMHFKVVRVLGTFLGLPYHNAWRPVLVGDIVPVPNGAAVRVRMRLQAFVAVFMVVWFGALLCFAALMLWAGLIGDHGFGPYRRDGAQFLGAGVGLVVIGGMTLAGYLLMSVSFWSEARKARALLVEGLGCRETDGQNRLVRVG